MKTVYILAFFLMFIILTSAQGTCSFSTLQVCVKDIDNAYQQCKTASGAAAILQCMEEALGAASQCLPCICKVIPSLCNN